MSGYWSLVGVWDIVHLIAVLKLWRFISLQLLSLIFFCRERKENSILESEFGGLYFQKPGAGLNFPVGFFLFGLNVP